MATDGTTLSSEHARYGRPSGSPRYLDPTTLMNIKSLELRAKSVVEGFWNGLHRSPYHGFSVEFTEYRPYSPGDDPRYLDGRLFARSDRYYIKRFEDETNLRCHLLLDTSRSMSFTSLAYTKADYAKTFAASIAYLLSTQRDAVGLATFDERIDENIPPRHRTGHMRRLMLALEKPVSGKATDLSQPLEQIAQQVTKRGMLILISEMLAPVETLDKSLGHLRARGHEVNVVQILDPAELTLDFANPALFHDIESGRELYIDPDAARRAYRENIQQHMDGIRTTCDQLGIFYFRFLTNLPLEMAFVEFMDARLQRRSPMARRKANTARRSA